VCKLSEFKETSKLTPKKTQKDPKILGVRPMKSKNWKNILKVTAAAAFLVVSGSQAAQAGELVNNWNYAYDSAKDGWTGGTVGADSAYEFYGMAVSEQDDNIFIAFNANLGIDGKAYSGAGNGLVGWGDLFFNFSGKDLKTANEEGSLFGIRFSSTNDSGASQTGVYKNVTGKNVAATSASAISSIKATQQKMQRVAHRRWANWLRMTHTLPAFTMQTGAFPTSSALAKKSAISPCSIAQCFRHWVWITVALQVRVQRLVSALLARYCRLARLWLTYWLSASTMVWRWWVN
jgi:hypothetical protein